MIQSNFIDMEKMLTLFEEEQTVKDVPNAKDLAVKEGHVVFGKVFYFFFLWFFLNAYAYDANVWKI